MSHTLINCTCKNRLCFSLLPFTLIPQYLKRFNWSKTRQTNEIWRQNSEIHSAFACFRWPPWFPDVSRPYSACLKRRSRKHMFALSLFVRVGSQMSPPRAKKDSNIPFLGRTKSVKCPPPGSTTTIKSPPHAHCMISWCFQTVQRMPEAQKQETYVRSQSFRPSRQSNVSTSGEERFKFPLPWENKISQMWRIIRGGRGA